MAALRRRRHRTAGSIPGETGGTYTLTADDVGHQVHRLRRGHQLGRHRAGRLRARRRAAVAADPPHVDDAARRHRRRSRTAPRSPPAPAAGPAPSRSPSPTSGSAATTDGTNCADIAGATDPTYTLTAADVAGTVRVVVTATQRRGRRHEHLADPTATVAAAPPVSTTPPAVTGTPVDGQTLTADPGAFSGTGPLTYDYQWQRCEADGTDCADIPGATGATYDLVSADVGGAIVVVVTATNAADSATATSAATTEVPAARAGQRLRADDLGRPARRPHADRRPGHLDRHRPDHLHLPVAALRRRRHRTAPTSSAPPTPPTRSSPGDIGHVLTVVVTATNARRQRAERRRADRDRRGRPAGQHRRPDRLGHARGRRDADRRPRHAGPAPRRSPTPTSGSAATPTAPTAPTIPGATGSHLRPAGADVGHAIVVEVTGTNAGGADAATSVPELERGGRPARHRRHARRDRHARRRPDADRRPRHLDRHGPDRLHLPVAALRRRRRQLRRHPRRHRRRPTRSAPTTSARPCASSSPATTASRPSVPSPAVGPVAALAPASTSVPTIVGHRRRRPHADRRRRRLGRQPAAHLHLPVAALRQRRRQLRRHRRRRPTRPTTSPTPTSATPSASRSPRPTPRATTPRSPRRPPRRCRRRPSTRRRPPAPTGTAVDGGTLTADRRRVDRRRPDHLHLPVAALRGRRHRLRRHRRRRPTRPTRRPAPTSAT